MIPRSVDRVAKAAAILAVGFLSRASGDRHPHRWVGASPVQPFQGPTMRSPSLLRVGTPRPFTACLTGRWTCRHAHYRQRQPPTRTPRARAGSIDSMPFFSSDGGRLYFSSSRAAFGAPFSIYSVAYPSTPSSPVITLATPPSNDNDYAPTVTADSSGGSVLDFLQCVGTSNCTLEEETLSPAGAPTEGPQQISTAGGCPAPVGPLSSADGQANRPEFNPTNPNQLVYVGESPSAAPDPGQENIYLLTINATPASTSCVDLSNTPTIIPASETYTASSTLYGDQGPDWSPDGTQIVFDSNRTGGDKLYEIDPASDTGAYQVWGGVNSSNQPLDTGEEVEPVYAPSDSPQGAYPKAAYPTQAGHRVTTPTLATTSRHPLWVWITGGGTNVTTLDDGTIKNPDPVTNDATNNPTLMATFVSADSALNVNPIWQPLTLGSPLAGSFSVPALLVGVRDGRTSRWALPSPNEVRYCRPELPSRADLKLPGLRVHSVTTRAITAGRFEVQIRARRL